MKILIVNGPNLNLLGEREPGIYGSETMENTIGKLKEKYPDVEFIYFQSNIEGELIDTLQAARNNNTDGVILNAGGYTHTSVALHDCIRSMKIPVVEVHISNVAKREEFRHTSIIGAACTGTIAGFGMDSYSLAVEAIRKLVV